MKVTMKIMMIQEVGKAKEEIKAGVMDMTMKTAIAIQEEVLAAWVIIVE